MKICWFAKMNHQFIVLVLLGFCSICKSNIQAGPDPWNHESVQVPDNSNEKDVPPDLRTPVKKQRQTESKLGFGEWWFKRLLAIILKSGQFKKNEDGSIDISLQMRFEADRWDVIDKCLKSESTLSDDKFRRTVAYIEDAIYKPTITDQIVLAWTDYIQVYLIQYKNYISSLLGTFAGVGIVFVLWMYMSSNQLFVTIFIILYIYEGCISYKEAEQQEYKRFVSAVNTCKWYFWSSDCTVPPPDPLIFIKHMNPMKIGVKLIVSIISEPIIALNSTIKIILQGVTDGIWYPFDKMIYGFLILIVNISLIYLLVMVVFNFIFNIPFNLNFLFGVLNIGVRQNRRTMFPTNTNDQPAQVGADTDRISGDRLDRLLNVCSLALSNVTTSVQNRTNLRLTNDDSRPKIKRSASTGRLPDSSSNINFHQLAINSNIRRRQNLASGDH